MLAAKVALFAGLERRFMPLREGYPDIGLPTTHYFLSLSRGDAIRTVMAPRAIVWAIAAIAALLIGWTVTLTAYFAFHDDVLRAVVAREAEIASAYDRRLAEARARLDEVATLRALDRDSFDARLKEVVSREARLERQSAVVAALARAADWRNSSPAKAASSQPGDALSAIEALGPQSPAGAEASAARAYAPVQGVGAESRPAKPHPVDEPAETSRVEPEAAQQKPQGPAAAADSPEAAARFVLVDRSLDRMDSVQMKALQAIDSSAERIASRDAAIVARTGLDPAKLAPPHSDAGIGGPFIPAAVAPDGSAFGQALARATRDLAMAERLKALLPFVPLRMPLLGDASVSSPFGYRADPFLGRLALHPGVDLIEAYGDEVRSAGAGRVIHAGHSGGYGIMVEIDHGNGLSTRYAHLSKALVSEGEDVAQGAILGRVGSTGRSTGPHLHYEVRVDGEPVDPERYLRAGADLAAAE